MSKILNLINPAKWIEGFLLSAFLRKAVAGGVVALLGWTASILPKLQEYGVSITFDTEKLTAAIVLAVGAIAGGLWNTAKHGPLKPE